MRQLNVVYIHWGSQWYFLRIANCITMYCTLLSTIILLCYIMLFTHISIYVAINSNILHSFFLATKDYNWSLSLQCSPSQKVAIFVYVSTLVIHTCSIFVFQNIIFHKRLNIHVSGFRSTKGYTCKRYSYWSNFLNCILITIDIWAQNIFIF